jgi:hypothetical protein
MLPFKACGYTLFFLPFIYRYRPPDDYSEKSSNDGADSEEKSAEYFSDETLLNRLFNPTDKVPTKLTSFLVNVLTAIGSE